MNHAYTNEQEEGMDPPKSALGALKIVYDENNAALEETQIRDLKIAMGCARF